MEFCPCQPDQVRLIHMGYIGGSPMYPELAFSLRLLRLHDSIWKYCSIRTDPFARALELFHRPTHLFLEDITLKVFLFGLIFFLLFFLFISYFSFILPKPYPQTRRWGRSLSAAVDGYRHIIRLKKELEVRALKLTSIEKLRANCPRCFGPSDVCKIKEEPDYIVCIDGNFQQRRHKDASVEHHEIEIKYPTLFLHPNHVKLWESNVSGGPSDDAPVSKTSLSFFSSFFFDN